MPTKINKNCEKLCYFHSLYFILGLLWCIFFWVFCCNLIMCLASSTYKQISNIVQQSTCKFPLYLLTLSLIKLAMIYRRSLFITVSLIVAWVGQFFQKAAYFVDNNLIKSKKIAPPGLATAICKLKEYFVYWIWENR